MFSQTKTAFLLTHFFITVAKRLYSTAPNRSRGRQLEGGERKLLDCCGRTDPPPPPPLKNMSFEDDSAEDNSNDNDNDRVPKRHRSTDVDDAAESDGDL